jgi:hypothetical protein
MTDAELIKELRKPTFYSHPATKEGRKGNIAADRIEQLVKERDAMLRVVTDNHDALQRAEVAEAKLTKATEALQAFENFDDMPLSAKRPDIFERMVRQPILAALAEINGE